VGELGVVGDAVGDRDGVVRRSAGGVDEELHATTTPDAAAPASIPSARRRLMSSGFRIASVLSVCARDH
jgi:hypothetical protein